MHNCAARVFLALVIAKVLLGELVDDSECRLEFLSPQPGDSVFDDDNLEVEVAMMDCMDISMNLQAAVHWNNERVVAFNGYIGVFFIPRPFKGHHTLFAMVECDETCPHAINGTAFFSVKSRPPQPSPTTATQLPLLTLPPWQGHHWKVSHSILRDSFSSLVSILHARIQDDPSDAGAYSVFARLLHSLGRLEDAVEMYVKALELLQVSPSSSSQIMDICASIQQAHEMRAAISASSSSPSPHPLSAHDLDSSYLFHLERHLPLDFADAESDTGSTPSVAVSDIAIAVVSGTSLYRTRALAVAETWLSDPDITDAYIYGDTAASLRACAIIHPDRLAECRPFQLDILQVPVPPGPNQAWLERITHRDDFFSSVPKFLLALLHLFQLHPHKPWFYLAGCDTYLLPRPLASSLSALDPSQKILLGGHAGLHQGSLFLSGGSGLVLSNGLVSALAPTIPSRLRYWLEWEGTVHRCAPCADIALAVLTREVGGSLLQRPCFFAYWPQRYLPTISDHDLRVAWRVKADGPRPSTTHHGHGDMGEGGSDEDSEAWGKASMPAVCTEVEMDRGGLGVAASEWWGKNLAMCRQPVAFHYLQPRAMRLLHRHVIRSADRSSEDLGT